MSGGQVRSRQAVAATRWHFGEPPALGMVTFIDARYVKGPHYGYSYKCAGFRRVGETKGGLLAFQLAPDDMPDAEMPLGAQLMLWRAVMASAAK